MIAKRTQQPTYYNKITFCSDGNEQNENAILNIFNKDCVEYGQVIKDKDKQKVIGLHKRKILGNISYDKIRINNVDGFCSYLRGRVGCFVRKTRNFAKGRREIISLLHITQTNYNFIETKSGKTPAMREGLTEKAWSWNDIFNVRLSINI